MNYLSEVFDEKVVIIVADDIKHTLIILDIDFSLMQCSYTFLSLTQIQKKNALFEFTNLSKRGITHFKKLQHKSHSVRFRPSYLKNDSFNKNAKRLIYEIICIICWMPIYGDLVCVFSSIFLIRRIIVSNC